MAFFDVNETLTDLSPLADSSAEVGVPATDVRAWFAGMLRDAFALTVIGKAPAFADIALSSLQVRLTGVGVQDPLGHAERVLARLVSLDPHSDVVPGLLDLAASGGAC